MKNISSQYWENQIKTASQGKLIVMLYDAALRHIDQALQYLPDKNYERIHQHSIKAQEIITELTLALKTGQDDFSQRLYAIYMYCNKKLIEGNIKKEQAPFLEVQSYLTKLRESWEKIAHKSEAQDYSQENNSGNINIES